MHSLKSMAIANGKLFSDSKGTFNAKQYELVNSSVLSYEEALNRINIEETDKTSTIYYTTMALYAPICHMPQAIGILIARLFGGNLVVQCYAARIGNFACSVFLMYYAIKLIPFKKHIILFLAMLPIVLNEFASMSSDALTIAISIFFICYCLYLKYDDNKKKITKKEITILTISAVIVALCKIVYIPLVLIVFILPKEKFSSLKNKNIVTIGIVVFAIILNLIWLIYCSRFLIEFRAGVNSGEQVKFVLTHPISYFLIAFRTLNVCGSLFITNLCGEGLGHFSAQASVIFVYSCIAIAIMLFFINDEKNKIKIDKITKIIFLFVFVAIVALIYTSLYVQWTSVGNSLIDGIQARYFIPILPLMAIILSNNKLIFDGKFDKRYLALYMLFFNLNAVTSIMFTYFIK